MRRRCISNIEMHVRQTRGALVSLGGLAGGAHLNPLLDFDRASAPLHKLFRSKSALSTAPLPRMHALTTALRASHARAHHGAVLSFSPQVRSGVSPSSSPPSCRHGAPPQCGRCTQADMHCQSRRVSLVSRARPGRPGQLSGGARAKDEALASVCQWRDSLHFDVSMRSTFPGSGAVWGVGQHLRIMGRQQSAHVCMLHVSSNDWCDGCAVPYSANFYVFSWFRMIVNM